MPKKSVLKVIVLGDFGTGKKTILRKYAGKEISDSSFTIGTVFYLKEIAEKKITL